MPPRRLAVNEITTRDWGFEQDVVSYHSHGITGIGLWISKLREYGVEKGMRLLREHGMHVCEVCYGGPYTVGSREELERQIEATEEAIDLTRRLEGDALLLVSGPQGGLTYTEALDRVVEAMKRLASMAERSGVRLALEPIHPMYRAEWSVIHTLDDCMEVMDLVGSESLGILFDVYHLWWDRKVFAGIERVGKRIFGVHINDWRRETRTLNDRVNIGDGVIPLKPILSALDRSGYRGYYSLEIMSDELWKADYNEVLRTAKTRFEQLWG